MKLILFPKRPSPFSGRAIRNASLGLAILAGLGSSLRAQSNYATPYTFSLFAGGGPTGSADGTGSAARFDEPYGLALDSGGNLWVADKDNQVIREITSGGAVTTFAGLDGNVGFTDDTGSAARFNQPTAVAVGSGGDLYVADSANDTIRKITPQGVVTTLAGDASNGGSTDGTGKAALFRQPLGVAIDSSGNVYVADFGNNSIRKVTQDGVVTTLAGTEGVAVTSNALGSPSPAGHADGSGSNATFNQPAAIAIDSSGNLYVADQGNSTIRKVTSGGVVTTLAGSPGNSGSTDGTGAAARFNNPRGVAVDGNGNVYVADSGNSLVRKVTPAGVVTTLAGVAGEFINGEGTGAAAQFDVPVGIAVDTNANLYVSQELGNVISKGAVATAIAPNITRQPASQTISTGSTVVFSSGAGGLPAPTYQWYFNSRALSDGAGVSGSAGPILVISNATAANAGTYTFAATNASGTAQSSAATLSVSPTSDIGRLINISCRSQVGTGANVLIAGFAVGGAGSLGSESVLIRASGPALEPFNVAGFLPDPELQLFSATSTLLASNTSWGGSAQIAAASAAVGAFAWDVPTSHDSALTEVLGTGTYSAEVSGQSGDSGVALVEVYDSTQGPYSPLQPRLVNISARTQVGTGANILIAGFVIGGSTSRTVLIRASGPALAPFNVDGPLADPELQLYAGSTLIDTNDAWGGNSEIAAAAASVGAFAWTVPTSNDSAILVTLAPGVYSAQVSGASGDTGVALVEVYEVP